MYTRVLSASSVLPVLVTTPAARLGGASATDG